MNETNRIRWHDEPKGNILGYVGTLDSWLFQIFDPDNGSGEWALMAQLPGALGEYRFAESPGKLKPAAEDWLNEFISSLGASFPAQDDDTAATAAGKEN